MILDDERGLEYNRCPYSEHRLHPKLIPGKKDENRSFSTIRSASAVSDGPSHRRRDVELEMFYGGAAITSELHEAEPHI